MGLQIVNGATGAKIDQIGCRFFKNSFDPMNGDLKKFHQKFPHKFPQKWVFFGGYGHFAGIGVECGNWGCTEE